jgi:PAS domain-containing protein
VTGSAAPSFYVAPELVKSAPKPLKTRPSLQFRTLRFSNVSLTECASLVRRYHCGHLAPSLPSTKGRSLAGGWGRAQIGTMSTKISEIESAKNGFLRHWKREPNGRGSSSADTATGRAESTNIDRNFQLLFTANPHPMFVVDRATLQFLEVNAAATREYGYTREEFLERKLSSTRGTGVTAARAARYSMSRFRRRECSSQAAMPC